MELRFAVFGGPRVGKTAICRRLVSHSFDPDEPPTMDLVEFRVRHMEFGVGDFLVSLEDTPPTTSLPMEEQKLVPWWADDTGNGQQGMIVVFDFSDLDTFDEAKLIIETIFRKYKFNKDGWKYAPVSILLVGNKNDLIANKIQVDEAKVNELINYYSSPVLLDEDTQQKLQHVRFVSISARLGRNVSQILPTLIQLASKLPTKEEVQASDLDDGLWGAMLREHKIARTMSLYMSSASKLVGSFSSKLKDMKTELVDTGTPRDGAAAT
eukprot:c8878_g1_i2.p1 GENE.c8878_g1_i2~~c8878_g1_i2.p1  ORF type:complete len:267 (-),score=75.29 c8878_g1_i2:225-1025(-)